MATVPYDPKSSSFHIQAQFFAARALQDMASSSHSICKQTVSGYVLMCKL